MMSTVKIAITAASFCGNKGAAAMLQSSIKQLRERYGDRLSVTLMSTYPGRDRGIISQLPEEYGFVSVVGAAPEKLLFLGLPLAVLYRLFGKLPPLGRLLRQSKMIRAYAECDLVIDEAGVAFVDSRGLVMNVYAFVCAAVPMLCGAPVCKYSQALGSFNDPVNRLLAKLVLPKMRFICARGEITKANLAKIGVAENVRLCADGAFTMPDCEPYIGNAERLFGGEVFDCGVSLSSVVDKRCRKLKIDYGRIMTEFIDGLCAEGRRVLIIANSAREDSDRPRNNDLPICRKVYTALRDKSNVRFCPRELPPEELRLLTARCAVLVASRFHAMIGALGKCVPVLLIGWSHKYREVLDMFELGAYAVDCSELSGERLRREFQTLSDNAGIIRSKIAENLPRVMESSRNNIALIGAEIDKHPYRYRRYAF